MKLCLMLKESIYLKTKMMIVKIPNIQGVLFTFTINYSFT